MRAQPDASDSPKHDTAEVLILYEAAAPSGSLGLQSPRYTLIVHSIWARAFWMSLVYANVRVGGLRERAEQDFEAGLATFPLDWPFTVAGEVEQQLLSAEAEAIYAKKPPAKRPNYTKLDTPSPFAPDWVRITGQKTMSTKTDDDRTQSPTVTRTAWLLTKASMAGLPTPDDCGLVDHCLRLRQNRRLSVIGYYNKPAEEHCYVRVVLQAVARGVPEDCAIVYDLSADCRREASRANQTSYPLGVVPVRVSRYEPSFLIRVRTGKRCWSCCGLRDDRSLLAGDCSRSRHCNHFRASSTKVGEAAGCSHCTDYYSA